MKPTIVNNVETLSNLPWLLCHGVSDYKAIGTESSPGTRLVAVSGHVNRPGVFEIPQGTTTYRDLFYNPEYGAGIRNGNELKMFIPGGASAPWFFAEQLDLPLEGARSVRQGRCSDRVPSSSWTTPPTPSKPASAWFGSSHESHAANAPPVAKGRPGKRRSSSGSTTATDAPRTSTRYWTSRTTSAQDRTRWLAGPRLA
jgi:hypothetical protein